MCHLVNKIYPAWDTYIILVSYQFIVGLAPHMLTIKKINIKNIARLNKKNTKWIEMQAKLLRSLYNRHTLHNSWSHFLSLLLRQTFSIITALLLIPQLYRKASKLCRLVNKSMTGWMSTAPPTDWSRQRNLCSVCLPVWCLVWWQICLVWVGWDAYPIPLSY